MNELKQEITTCFMTLEDLTWEECQVGDIGLPSVAKGTDLDSRRVV